jgi:hypothetical protein
MPLRLSRQMREAVAAGREMMVRVEDMRGNPKGDWRIGDVEVVCRQFGIFCQPSRGGGSHYKIAHRGLAEKLTIPARRPIKPIYIRRFAAFVELVRTLS